MLILQLVAHSSLQWLILVSSLVASGLRQRDAAFSKQESDDFILRVFATGGCWGKGDPLTDAERVEFKRRIDEDVLICVHTRLRVHFFVSFLFEMASPDRTKFFKTTNKNGRTIYDSYLYSDPRQFTVRSSYWAQRY